LRGAAALGQVIYDRYGDDGIALILDEGFSGISTEFGKTFASLGMAEKGAVNVQIKVETLGGHSSVPPVHTGSKLLCAILTYNILNMFL
jgi:Gly-Xaa carboxypeptidase